MEENGMRMTKHGLSEKEVTVQSYKLWFGEAETQHFVVCFNVLR